MDDMQNQPDAEPSRPEPIVGVPVGTAPEGARRPTGLPTPSWVVPMIVLALVAGLAIGLAVGLLVGGDQAGGTAGSTTTAAPTTTAPWDPGDVYAAVSVTGDPLPLLVRGSADSAVGLAMPQITGSDYAGNARAIADNGKAKLIVALAHWCPYCNDEMPILQDWYAAGIPEGIEVISLSVYANPAKANFPPARWLSSLNWSLPVIADDEAQTLVGTLGIPAVPYWLLVDADGFVLGRVTGSPSAEQLDGWLALLQAPTTTTTP